MTIDRMFMTHPLTISIVEDHKKAVTEKDKAMLEQRLWALVTPAMRQSYMRRNLLREVFGPAGDSDRRQELLNAPDTLWQRIDDGSISLSMATWLWREAKKAARKQNTMPASELPALLVRFDQAPVKARIGGKVIKKKFHSDPRRNVETESTTFRSSWIKIRQELRRMLEKRAKGLLENVHGDRLMIDFEREIRSVIESFGQRIERVRQDNRKIVSRRALLDACHVLHMDPPKSGLPVDMDKASKQKRRFARAYHPDATRDESMRPQYEAVIAAFGVIEDYFEQAGGTKAGEEHAKGDTDGTVT